MNVIVPKVFDLENENPTDVVLLFKPEIGTFDIGLRREGELKSILKLELNEIDKTYLCGGIQFINEKAEAYISDGLEGIKNLNIDERAKLLKKFSKNRKPFLNIIIDKIKGWLNRDNDNDRKGTYSETIG